MVFTGQTPLHITMETDSKHLDEVVVIGYGTSRRKGITGSVVSVKVEESLSQQVQTVDQLLQGK